MHCIHLAVLTESRSVTNRQTDGWNSISISSVALMPECRILLQKYYASSWQGAYAPYAPCLSTPLVAMVADQVQDHLQCLIMHLLHTNRVLQYLSDSVQTVARSSSRPDLRSSDTAVYAKPRCRTKFGGAASLMLDLLHGTVFHTISIKSVTLVFSSATSKLNYFVQHTSLALVSAPGRSVNSAILSLLLWA